MIGNHTVLQEVLILLAASVVAVALFRRLRLPAVLAYLAVGLVVGPHALGWVPYDEGTQLLGEFGVVFLLFTVGLKFSLAQLFALRREVLGLGGGQVVATVVVATVAGWLLGLPFAGALIAGGALAMSSTAMVLKLLSEQVELGAAHGRTATGVLLFQDLAVLPFLIMIPALAGAADATAGQMLIAALGKGTLVILLMLAAGRWLLRPVLHAIGGLRSPELFTLTALLFALLAAGASHAAGVSMAMGAFVAGMMLGETEFRHQVEADIRPFQDVLLGLFFITIGMRLDLAGLPAVLLPVLLLLTATLLFKGGLIALLSRLSGVPGGVGLRTAIVLAQGGEFGLALLALASDAAILPDGPAQALLSSIILSMALTPWLVRHNARIARLIWRRGYERTEQRMVGNVGANAKGMAGHVVVCGYGRVGQSLARILDQESIPYIALDLDPVRVREARAAGETVVYGDATGSEILEAAGVARARVLVVSFDDVDAAAKVLSRLRAMGVQIPALVRTADDGALERLQRAGATEVVPETLEAGLILASHLLVLLQIPPAEIARHVQSARRDRYRLLRGFFLGEESLSLEAGVYRERLHTVTLSDTSAAVGRRLMGVGLREAGVVVTAIRRGGIRGQQPQPDMVLRPGDTLVLYGAPEVLERAESLLLRG